MAGPGPAHKKNMVLEKKSEYTNAINLKLS